MRSPFVTLVLALLLSTPAWAQEQRGSIEGVVTDSSGAAMPGVTVEARSTALVGVATAVTDERGIYRFPALPPGFYRVSATLQGFTTAQRREHRAAARPDSQGRSLAGRRRADRNRAGDGGVAGHRRAAERRRRDHQCRRHRAHSEGPRLHRSDQDRARHAGRRQVGHPDRRRRRLRAPLRDRRHGHHRHPHWRRRARRCPPDFMQEVQVKSSGYNAEFRATTGGVVSAITKTRQQPVPRQRRLLLPQ